MRLLPIFGMLFFAVLGLSLAAAPHAFAATTSVSVEDNKYVPPTVTINVGDTVHWTWAGANPHTVTATDSSFDSGASKTSGTFDHTFNTPGTFTYFCKVHGAQVMSGTVVVQQGAAPTQPAAAPTSAPAASGSAPAAASTTPRVAATTTAGVSGAPGVATPMPATGSGGAALPQAGTGDTSERMPIGYLPLTLAIAGVGLIALAVVVKRRV